MIPLLLQYFTKFNYGFFGLRGDNSRNENREFIMCRLFFAEATEISVLRKLCAGKVLPLSALSTVPLNMLDRTSVKTMSRFRFVCQCTSLQFVELS